MELGGRTPRRSVNVEPWTHTVHISTEDDDETEVLDRCDLHVVDDARLK